MQKQRVLTVWLAGCDAQIQARGRVRAPPPQRNGVWRLLHALSHVFISVTPRKLQFYTVQGQFD